MIEDGTLIPDRVAWDQFVAELVAKQPGVKGVQARVLVPKSFPLIAYSLSLDPPRVLVVGRDQLAQLELVSSQQTNHVNDFRDDEEIEGVVVHSAFTRLDNRGWLAEVARCDVDGEVAMVYVSVTRPGVTRGPHEHRNQVDRFLFIGEAVVWLWDNRKGSVTDGVRQAVYVHGRAKILIPPGIVHAYRNNASTDLVVVNAPSQLYKGRNRQDPVDEVRHEDDPQSRFKPW